MRIIAKDQMSTEFFIESNVLFADRIETLVRHCLMRKKNVLRVKLNRYNIRTKMQRA